jgi:hypothetical protein
LNNGLVQSSYAKEDFYSQSNSYIPKSYRESGDSFGNSRRPSQNTSLYSKRIDRSDTANGSQSYSQDRYRRESRPSLIPKDFKDDYNDDEDEEMEKKLRQSDQTESQTPEANETETKLQVSTDPSMMEDIKGNDGKHEVKAENSHYQVKAVAEDNVENIATDEVKLQQLIVKESSPSKDDESDNYDPEADQSLITDDIKDVMEKVDISPKKLQVPSSKQLDTDSTITEPTAKSSSTERKEIEEVEKKQIIVPLETPDADIFPLPKLEDKVWEYKNRPRKDVISQLPYLLNKKIKKVEDYPFYSRNFLVHEQVTRPKLLKNLSIIKTNTFLIKASLTNEYQQRSLDWDARLREMDDQLAKLYPNRNTKSVSAKDQDESQTQLTSNEQEGDHGSSRASTSRRGGRGDAVHSEAEFLEILKSLGADSDNDPLQRAEHLAAEIPDMILNPIHKGIFLTNVNNLVLDKEKWASSINYDGVDNFTRKEHEMFCEAFLSYPKRFGRISSLMGGLRTPEECVTHYYKTKKTLTDYKQLLALKKRRRKGPKVKRGPRPKSSAATPNTTIQELAAESGDELSLDHLIPKEAVEDAYYTETGRRRRAAAPVFDSSETDNAIKAVPFVVEQIERKRSLDIIQSAENVVVESSSIETIKQQQQPQDTTTTAVPVKKKQRGPKPKKALENPSTITGATAIEAAESVDPANSAESKNKAGITSYWSVKDINLFTSLLGLYGQNWIVIAEHLKTKSPIMVRNYYHRNADTHGWKEVAASAESKTAAQNADIIAPKNPPLGLFTASNNVPSNINTVTNTSPRPDIPVLPPVNPLSTTLSVPSTSVQHTLLHSIPSNGPKEMISRSSPFSITSLLNPPDEVKPSPLINSLGGSDNREVFPTPKDIKAERSYDPVKELTGPVHTVQTQQPGFNPLNALIDAAQNTAVWNNLQQPQQHQAKTIESSRPKAFDPVRPMYNENSSSYNGGFQASYSESSLRGARSILNDVIPQESRTSLPSISSNLKNVLIPEATTAKPAESNGEFKEKI